MPWSKELAELREREARAKELGGADKVARQHDGGRLTVRERIDALLDNDSFHEVGALAGAVQYDANGEITEYLPANCVMGRGTIDGRPVVVSGDDFTGLSEVTVTTATGGQVDDDTTRGHGGDHVGGNQFGRWFAGNHGRGNDDVDVFSLLGK